MALKLTCVLHAEVEFEVLRGVQPGVRCRVPRCVDDFFLLQEVGERLHHEKTGGLARDVDLGLGFVD